MTFVCVVKVEPYTLVSEARMLWFLFRYPVSKPSYGLDEFVPASACWFCIA